MDRPTNLMVITGIFVFDEPIELERIRDVISKRLVPIRRFRERIVKEGRRYWWEEQPDFDVRRHVVAGDLDEPRDERALQKRAAELMGEPLDPDLPLWKFEVHPSVDGGSAIVTRLHHAIGDGVALMMATLSLMDLEAEHADLDPCEANPLAPLFYKGEELNEAAIEHARTLLPEAMRLMERPSTAAAGARSGRRSRLVAKATRDMARLVFRFPDPKTLFKGELAGRKAVSWTAPIDFERVRELKQRLGCTVNDALMTALAGGLGRYLSDRGQPVDGVDIRAVVPVSLRPVRRLAELGNEFGLVFMSLPMGIADPRDRLGELKTRMDALKGSVEAGLTYGILRGMGLAGRPIHELIVTIFGTKASTVLTNVPGPKRPLYFAGNRIRDMLFWVPSSGTVGMGLSILSYDGQVRVGVATDAGLVPDPHAIVEAVEDEFERLTGI